MKTLAIAILTIFLSANGLLAETTGIVIQVNRLAEVTADQIQVKGYRYSLFSSVEEENLKEVTVEELVKAIPKLSNAGSAVMVGIQSDTEIPSYDLGKIFMAMGENPYLQLIYVEAGPSARNRGPDLFEHFGVSSKKSRWEEPAGKPLKLDTKEARTVVESNKMGISDHEVRTKLRNALRDYDVVSKVDWTHKYSHVGGMDASGIIEWPVPEPSVKWNWMLRPGGLAMLTKPDGTAIYLAREKQPSEGAAPDGGD